MTSPDRPLRVFVNAAGIDVSPGSTALDAVRSWNASEADAVVRGERVITDSRGLPVKSDVAVQAGSIFRLVTARRTSDGADGAAIDDNA